MNAVPVVLISGLDETPMEVLAAALLWDMPNAVAVRHQIDPVRNVLIRTVSDVSGLIERHRIDIEHACASCAIREDVVPTLDRLAATGLWASIVVQLPVTAEATHVCRVIAMSPRRHRRIRVAASIVALEGDDVCDDLLGDDLIVERELPAPADDRRGVGEVGCSMVEYADIVAMFGEPSVEAGDLVRALCRPSCSIVTTAGDIDSAALMRGIHSHQASEVWAADVRRYALPRQGQSTAWILDLRSELPLHPDRLRHGIAELGAGPRRSRGCFWLPTRAAQVCAWDGAGGQLSIGASDRWGTRDPLTRLVVVGLDDGRDELERAFRECLVTTAEIEERGRFWEVESDGFEPWLGGIGGTV